MKSETYVNPSEILWAVTEGYYYLAAWLQHHEYEVDAREDDGGRTLLHWAVQENRTNILHLLLSRGANPEALDEYSITPFSSAASDGNLRFLKIMRHHGANPSGVPGINVPLIIATAYCRSRCVRYLLYHGANPNACDSKGATALLMAVHHGHHVLASLLLRHGARTDVRDEDGGLLWEIREGGKTPKTTRKTEQNGLTLWEMAIENEDTKMLKILNSSHAE